MASADSTIVLITGANQGLGFGMARKLATDYPGYHILLGSRDPSKGVAAASELKEQGLSVELITIDVGDDKSIDAAAEDVTAKYGRLDVLINNAGISVEMKLKDTKSQREIWQMTLDTNTTGHFIVTEAFVPLLKKSTLPRIVFTSSSLGSLTERLDPNDQFSSVSVPAYRASKAALNMVACHYAALYGSEGWKVNTYDPGYCATNLNDFRGANSPEIGVQEAVRLATLDKNGPTGTFSSIAGIVPW
jgi:NAD(P)-dependent dehydrogenase (short-subunit alcohol dehydrogenase family)